jgi:hypothetical protein
MACPFSKGQAILIVIYLRDLKLGNGCPASGKDDKLTISATAIS